MRELIGECPNIVPSGLGNGNSEMDMSMFTDGLGAASEEEEEDPRLKGRYAGVRPRRVKTNVQKGW